MATVLVVDDSAVDRKLAVSILGHEPGWTIEEVENGRDALARLKQGGIDIVVTDMMMPDVSGLDLIDRMQISRAPMPVVLMTGQGTEVLAMQALQKGATSYVPKRMMTHWLVDTIKGRSSLAHEKQSRKKLLECFEYTQFSLTLDNEIDTIEAAVDHVRDLVHSLNTYDPSRVYHIVVSLREALLNSLYHGSLELTLEQIVQNNKRLEQEGPSILNQRRSEAPYCDRTIQLEAYVGRSEVRFTIRDQGPGFDVAASAPASEADALTQCSGRGLALIHTFMDRVEFNDAGNEIVMVKACKQEE